MNKGFHSHTPQLAVIDNRGLPVRQVAYWRRDAGELRPEALVTAQEHDGAGRLVAQRDPRFLAPASRPNMATVYSLSGAALCTDSRDAGWRLGLPDRAGQMREHWDGRGSHWQNEYDAQRRLTAVHEQTRGSTLRTVERLTYADNAGEFAERNQCGQLIRHDDRAGVVWLDQQALNGGVIRQRRRFLPDQPNDHPHWPVIEAERDTLLQPGAGYITASRIGPLGQVLEQTDAAGHRQHFSIDRAGQLQRIDLTLDSQGLQPLLKAASYNAEGQLLTQVTGNDVTSSATYEAASGRLKRLTATTQESIRLQDLRYEYDPVGNILRLVDHTQPVTFFSNQRVAAENTYTYDSRYQLTCATGRETANAGQNPGLPELITPSPIDPGRLLNYTEFYEYDASGNRTELRHVRDENPFRQQLRVDPQSNRALPWNEGEDEPDFPRNFDANGNQQYLAPGAQPMTWDALNQLQSVTTVGRPTEADDAEGFRYNAAGERVVKFSTQQARAVAHRRVVHYLPGLEVRTTDDAEELQVICVPLARGSVRCLHWVKGKPGDIEADQLRYSVDDHLGSCSLELDKHAAVISHEGYYTNGGTAWWAARSKVDADYKTLRYSGKERDACGLYYYGFRYFAPWLGRWVSPDPAGHVDGLNLFKMVGNNPLVYRDLQGREKTPVNKEIILIWAGENPGKLKDRAENINNIVTQADGYKVNLYIDTYAEDTFNETLKDLKVHEVHHLQGSEEFNRFYATPASSVYDDFRNYGEKNLAFAVDVLRVHLLNERGGLYSDSDDIYYDSKEGKYTQLGNTSLEAEPDQVLTLLPNTTEWNEIPHVNNSSFAAHANNASLKAILDEMVVRYDKAVANVGRLDPNGLGFMTLNDEKLDRTNLLISMVGAGVLTDVLSQRDPVFNSIVTHFADFQAGRTKVIDQDLIAQSDILMPLSRHIKSGGMGTW
ncbi:RHS repeat domain-containing protein [Pseudomonas sp. GT1P32]